MIDPMTPSRYAPRTLYRVGKRFFREERAATAVELSLVMGAFLLLLFGAIDWSRYYYNRGRLREAVRRGALFGARLSLGTYDSTTIAAATRAALMGTATERALGTVDVELTGTSDVERRVQVTWMGYPFTRATALLMPANRADTVRAEFRLEQP